MNVPPNLRLYERLYNKALQLRNESERMLFLAVFAALGVLASAGVGYICKYTSTIPYILFIGTVLSSFLLIPFFLWIGLNLWGILNKSRALSGDEFAYLSYLKDEYERDVKEIQALPLPESEKKKLIRERFEGYVKLREIVRGRIQEQIGKRRNKYYLGD